MARCKGNAQVAKFKGQEKLPFLAIDLATNQIIISIFHWLMPIYQAKPSIWNVPDVGPFQVPQTQAIQGWIPN